MTAVDASRSFFDMDVILIPGLWLDASTWDEVVPVLRESGLTPRPLTMPGLGVPAPDSADIGMADWVATAVDAIDAAEGPVVVVGHSAGGNVAWGATDARPDRVARVILVDTMVPFDGGTLPSFGAVDGVVPFPGWDAFDPSQVSDLDEATRAAAAARMQTVPARVTTDPIVLRDDRRLSVPVTVLSGHFDDEGYRSFIAQWDPRLAAEFEAIAETEVVTLDSGHWPQFSQPVQLAQAIVAAVQRS